MHLAVWPKLDLPAGRHGKKINKDLITQMQEARNLVTLALAQRIEQKLKVKQPLASLKVKNEKSMLKGNQELLDLVKDEINVKEIIFSAEGGPASGWDGKEVMLDINITEELRQEGQAREIVRQLQEARKTMGLKPQDRIEVYFTKAEALKEVLEKYNDLIKTQARANNVFVNVATEDIIEPQEIIIDGQTLLLTIKKI